MRDALSQLVTLWVKQLDLCEASKWRHFGKTAKKIWQYLGKEYRSVSFKTQHDSDDKPFPYPKGLYYRPKINKSAEFISVVLPYVLAKVPHRQVSPWRPELPMELRELNAQYETQRQQEQLEAWVQQWYLNYIPKEYGLLAEQRKAVPEGLGKGRGLVWHELSEGPYGVTPASYFESVDNLLIDADAEQLKDAAFVIRKRHRSAWAVAQQFAQFGITTKHLRSTEQSNLGQSIGAAKRLGQNQDQDRRPDEEGDIVDYFEVWSRMGLGHLLYGASDELKQKLQNVVTEPHVWLVFKRGLEFPLNLTPSFIENATEEQIRAAIRWPVALYGDAADPWPFSQLDFYPNGRDPWGTSPLEAPLPLQVFLDHIYAYLMDRIRVTCRNIYLIDESCDEETVDAIVNGYDQQVVWKTKAGDNTKLVHVIEFPQLNPDAWRIIAMVETAFERMSGDSPLLAGGELQRQMRSAREAEYREVHATSRPEDFADCVENWNTIIACKEARMARQYVKAPWQLFREPPPEQSTQIPGGMTYPGLLSQVWENLRTDDPYLAAAEFEYTVEHGTGRKKNKEKRMADAQMLAQTLLPSFLQIATMGMKEPFNNLMQLLGEAYDMPLERLMLEVAPVMANPEQQAAQAVGA